MPIRTNRGRAAVYRRLWGWPLRSPRHLVVTIIGIVILAIAIAVLTQRAGASGRHTPTVGAFGDTSMATATATPGGTSSVTATPSITATRLSSPPPPPSVTPPALAVLVIRGWAQRWVNHPVGMTNQQWLDQLRPYTTAEFLPVMSSIDVSNIAATQITGDPRIVKSYADSVEALVPTNAGRLDITAINTPQGWLVATYTEAQ